LLREKTSEDFFSSDFVTGKDIGTLGGAHVSPKAHLIPIYERFAAVIVIYQATRQHFVIVLFRFLFPHARLRYQFMCEIDETIMTEDFHFYDGERRKKARWRKFRVIVWGEKRHFNSCFVSS
jgi:hypothetical protein